MISIEYAILGIALLVTIFIFRAHKKTSSKFVHHLLVLKISDSYIPIDSNSTIPCINPATGAILCDPLLAASPSDVFQAVKDARAAQTVYANSSFLLRKSILLTLKAWIIEKQNSICEISSKDTVLDATFGEIIPTLEKLDWTIANGEHALATEHRQSGTISFLSSPRVEYYPVGVMGLIVSWNYPIHNVISPIISALMAGNACVVKCSEHTAWTAQLLQRLIHEILEYHDVDRNLVTFINGFADAGEALVQCADKITFIGSPNVGKMVMSTASATLTPVILELGGKDAAVIFEDCAYNEMLKICMRAGLQNAGQNCAGLERMVVQSSIFERFCNDAARIYGNARVGSPFDEGIDVGAITMAAQIPIIQSLVDDALSKGARILCGGKSYIHPNYPLGQYYLPTVITDITPEMKIYTEEVFGPVLLIFKFDGERDAVKIVNGTPFGLGSAVFSMDYTKAERVSRQFHTGMSNVNGWGFNYLCQSLPFGGVGKSGFDRFGGIEGLRGNCNIRSATTDRFGSLGIRTSLPSIIDYPIKPKSLEFQASLIEMIYADGLYAKAKGALKLLNAVC